MANEFIGKRVSCDKIKDLYPNTWVVFDDYSAHDNSGVLLAVFDSRAEMRQFLLRYKERGNSIEYFPTTEEGEYNFLCQL